MNRLSIGLSYLIATGLMVASCGGSDGNSSNPFDLDDSAPATAPADSIIPSASGDLSAPADSITPPASGAVSAVDIGRSTTVVADFDFPTTPCRDGSPAIAYESDTHAFVVLATDGSVTYESAYQCGGDPDGHIFYTFGSGDWDPTSDVFSVDTVSEVNDRDFQFVSSEPGPTIAGVLDVNRSTIRLAEGEFPITAAFHDRVISFDELRGSGADGEAAPAMLDTRTAYAEIAIDPRLCGDAEMVVDNQSVPAYIALAADGTAVYEQSFRCITEIGTITHIERAEGTWNQSNDTFVLDAELTAQLEGEPVRDMGTFQRIGTVDHERGLITISGTEYPITEFPG